MRTHATADGAPFSKGHRGASSRPAAPSRTCAACRKEAEQRELIRWVQGPEGTVAVDLAQRAFGRGAWLHPSVACLAQAPKALARSFKAPVDLQAPQAFAIVLDAATRRVDALLASARGAGQLVLGATLVKQDLARGRVELLLVARDARAAAESYEVAAAIQAGRAHVWRDKRGLGRLFKRDEVGVVGVLDAGLASALSRAVQIADMCSRHAPSGVVGVGAGTEVG